MNYRAIVTVLHFLNVCFAMNIQGSSPEVPLMLTCDLDASDHLALQLLGYRNLDPQIMVPDVHDWERFELLPDELHLQFSSR